MVLFWATPSACLHGADAQAVREAAQQGTFIASELGEESGVSLADGGVVHVFRGGRRARVFEPGGCSAVRCAAVEACVGLGLDVAFCRGHEIRQPYRNRTLREGGRIVSFEVRFFVASDSTVSVYELKCNAYIAGGELEEEIPDLIFNVAGLEDGAFCQSREERLRVRAY